MADHSELIADGGDMTRILIQAMDNNNQILSQANFIVELSLTGAGVLVGENPLVLEAGQAAVYVRTTRRPGSIKVKAISRHLQTGKVEIVSVPLNEKIVPLVK
jgi:beta-galactosidase